MIEPFLLTGICVVIENTNTDINKIILIVLIIFLIKKLYIKIIYWIRKILVLDKEK